MQSRKDQVQAHLFVLGRLSSSMLRDDPDTPDAPLGRTRRGMGCGIVLAVLIAVGVGLYGLLVPGGNTSWRTDGTLVVVKDSGARYLYTGGRLHPVLNMASAKLLAGDSMTTKTVASASLDSAARGAPLGIVGAPDGLPGSGDLRTGSWAACTTRDPAGRGKDRGRLSVAVGDLPSGRGLADKEATLVTGPDGTRYALWRGQRLALPRSSDGQAALGWSGRSSPSVPAAFLDTLPAGPDLAAPHVPGRGDAGPRLSTGTTRLGQLFEGAGGQHYLLRRDGLVPLTPLLYELLRGAPATQEKAYGGGTVGARRLGPSDLAEHRAPETAAGELARGLPRSVPKLVTAGSGQAVCAQVTPHGRTPSTAVVVRPADAVPSGAPALRPGVGRGCLQADQVWVENGGGALVGSLSSSGAGGARYLVTDDGVAYPLAAGAAERLGYDGARQVRLPDAWLQLLPAGPTLDASRLSRTGLVRAAERPADCGREDRPTGSAEGSAKKAADSGKDNTGTEPGRRTTDG
ncbi:type VII secretion protein EccB [Streptomyces sp. SID1143]|uniref:type VII secretion protein EccB n=1 Tax=Streptomyces sp. SID1143 TaxID=3425889 RepID=UPI0040561D9A